MVDRIADRVEREDERIRGRGFGPARVQDEPAAVIAFGGDGAVEGPVAAVQTRQGKRTVFRKTPWDKLDGM